MGLFHNRVTTKYVFSAMTSCIFLIKKILCNSLIYLLILHQAIVAKGLQH